MRTVGFRAAPKAVTFAIYDSVDDSVINVEEIKIPTALDAPAALKYVRNTVLDLLREYQIEAAGIRATEPAAQSLDISRVQVEGVIQESFASSNLKTFYVGHIATISRRVGIDRVDFKPMVDGTKDPGVQNWGAMSPNEREAILCAKGAAHA